MTVKEAIKKLRNHQKNLVSKGCPVDPWYDNLIADLKRYPDYTPMDSPKLKDDENG